MNTKEIMNFMAQFLRKDFKKADAIKIFGNIEDDKDDAIPETIELQPKNKEIDSITLSLSCEKEEYDSKNPPDFLEAISLDFVKPFEIDFEVLIKEYGKPKESVRLHPEDPIPVNFDVKGDDYRGQLEIGVVGKINIDRNGELILGGRIGKTEQALTVWFRRFSSL